MSAPANPRATSSANVAAAATPMAMAVSASAVGGSFPPNATKVDAAPRSATVARSTRRSAITVPTALPNDFAPLCFSSQPRYTSPIFAGNTQFTQNERVRISVAVRREICSPDAERIMRQRNPRRGKVLQLAPSATRSHTTLARLSVAATSARLNEVAARTTPTTSTTVSSIAKIVERRDSRASSIVLPSVR